MKLYYHPASTTSRAVLLGASEMGVQLDLQLIDLMTGAHLKPEYAAVNPNCLVPCLDDDGLKLTESATILRYLAEGAGSPAYPSARRDRALVNEAMDWANSNLYRDLGYQLVYPQLFPHHRRPTEETQRVTLEWGRDKSHKWLKVLDSWHLGDGRKFLCGNQPTIADYFVGPMISITELIHADISGYANVSRWYGNVKALASWPKVNEVFDGFVASLKDQEFVGL